MRTPRTSTARAIIAATAVAALSFAASPSALAHSDHGKDAERAERLRDAYTDGTNVPLVNSPNVRLAASFPETAGISGCFLKSAPLFVMSSLDSLSVFDVSNPVAPELVGTLPNLVFENEAINCGERKTKNGTERFALIGVDLYDASSDIDHTASSTGGNRLIVVDVTDPANPRIRSSAPTTSSTHTVACVAETDCRYAYSAGERTTFSMVNLDDLDKPYEVDGDPATDGVQPFASPSGGHKWNFDAAGYGTHTGYNGSSIFDVRDPARPRLVTTTGAAGRGLNADGTKNGYNDFIHHNSSRPNAAAFRPDAPPSFANGNVLLVTEEDYEDVNCSTAGSFQTWWVKRLDGTPDAIVPLDKVELSDLGSYPVPVGSFCSAHWFDHHPSGIVTVGYYGGGTQLVDARDPRDLKPYGHAVWGASEVWDSYWVPVYNRKGSMTDQRTNIAYSVDLVRGLDVYTVDLPGDAGAVLEPAGGLPAVDAGQLA
ncbi:hypothetical protein P0Y31_03645 [Knoellia sp. 3-2P3]|uniref:hypothetical protein n=1 Tax=unclassified Knoellia TaxID=2618719 RepID=UPI0023DC3731|nr:hypothetical protein [Knoellia sp. 3-2P3]MDF2091427.1 hypothetical protein [Knoellia sp. 3-2P3]